LGALVVVVMVVVSHGDSRGEGSGGGGGDNSDGSDCMVVVECQEGWLVGIFAGWYQSLKSH
jgi:hypothetical protein